MIRGKRDETLLKHLNAEQFGRCLDRGAVAGPARPSLPAAMNCRPDMLFTPSGRSGTAVKTVREFLDKTNSDIEVTFCGFSRQDLDIYAEFLRG